MDWIQLFVVPVVMSIVLIVILLTGFAYLSYAERKLVGRFTMRPGPNRAGPFGLLQPIADAVKMAFKEELMPRHADKAVYLLAPGLAVSSTFLIWAVIPVAGQSFAFFGYTLPPVLADLNVAILYLAAITSLGSYAIVLGGWASNNKYSLLGALRTSAQMVSYELPLGLTMVTIVLVAGTLSTTEFVDFQANNIWMVVVQPIAFIIFFIATLAEIGRSPFDLPETENELVSGYITEYGAIRFALFMMSEYMHVITAGALVTVLFLGGWHGPFAEQIPFLGVIYFVIKIVAVIFTIIWVRASVPRPRYDQLMRFCWKVLTPIAMVNLAVTAIVVTLLG